MKNELAQFPLVSVIIPARNEESLIGTVVRSVIRQRPVGVEVEVIVVDDGSSDRTAFEAQNAGATVLDLSGEGKSGNPAAARNCGARKAKGDLLVFLDADCVPLDGWLRALLSAHQAGEVIVGGALELPPGLSFTARCDYYCGWYLVHPKCRAGHVPHHPPPNLSVRRTEFLNTSGFSEQPPLEYTNEERKLAGRAGSSGTYHLL
jgi:glycosyltransferase involved in cell wall biosynthesis